MILKRLTDILRTFGSAEFKRLEKFVRSDYFNTNKRIVGLLRELKKFYSSFTGPKLSPEYLFRQVYPAEKFKEKTYRYLLSELLHLTQKFLAISFIESETTELRKNTIDALVSRRLFPIARSHLKELDKEVEKNFAIGATYLHNKMETCLLWHLLFYSSSVQNPVMQNQIEGAEYQIYDTIMDLCHIYQNLDAIKRSHNIEYPNNALFAFVRNFDFKGMLRDIEELERIRSSRSFGKNEMRLIGAFKFYLCFMITFLDKKDEVHFQKMKGIVEEYGGFFKKTELLDVHVMLTNCCNIKRKTINDARYLKLSFELMKNALAKDLYLASKGQYMFFSSYFRILETALALKELAWAEDFVAGHIKDIAPDIKDDVYNYSVAEIRFHKKQFGHALESLAKIKFDYALHKSNVRSLTLMAYYELDYYEQAYSMIDSYSHFLSKNEKLTPQQREGDSNFLRFTKKILKLREYGVNGMDLNPLQEQVKSCLQLSRKEWLLEKAGELNNRNP